MAHARKTRTPYADGLEQWVAQGWLTGQETCLALHDMATRTDLMYREAAGSREAQAKLLGITGRLQEVLTPLQPRGAHRTKRKALTPTLDAHPGRWPRMALYGLRRQRASSRGGLFAPSERACKPRGTSPQRLGKTLLRAVLTAALLSRSAPCCSRLQRLARGLPWRGRAQGGGRRGGFVPKIA